MMTHRRELPAHAGYDRNATIPEVFARRVLAAPDAPAVMGEDAALSYAELDLRSNQLANHLRALGVGPEDAVGVALPSSAAVPVALLGILKAGGAYVPLDLAYPRERLDFMIEDASLRLILTGGGLREGLSGTPAPVLDLDEAAARIAAEAPVAPPLGTTGNALAYITYTSGSTGRPKGVAIEHRGVVRLVCDTDYVDIRPDDVVLQFAPLAFDASTFELWGALLNGARLAMPEPGPLSMTELGACLQRHGVTTLWLTAPLFRLMVETELESLGGLRTLLTGGDVVSPEHAKRFLEAFPSCALINGYGPTENTTFSCCYRVPSAAAIGAALPIGRPIANSSAYVLDRDLRPVPPGASGELCVGGDGVARGYVNLPELSARRFVPDPFSADPAARLYRTGDLARMRPDGVLDFLGRLDRQVKIRGFRIELEELEGVLREHPSVADAALSVVVARGEKALYAHVVSAGSDVDERGLRRFLGAKLPAYMIPTHLALIADLPKNPSGKIDRRALAERAAEALRPELQGTQTNRPVLGM